MRFFCSDALLRALLPEAAAAPPAGRGAEPAAEQPPRARFHRRHGSGNRRADTGMPGRARFKRTLLVPKPALARLLGNGRQPVRVGPTRRHSRGVAVRSCAWGRETAPSRAASEAITRRKTSRAATLTAASQLGFRGNDVQMMFCSCLAVCLLLQHPSQCEYLVPTRTKKSLQSYTALGKLLLLLTAPSAHRQKLPQGLSWRGPPISPVFGRFSAGLGAPAPSCRDLPAKPSRWGVTKAEAAGRREGEPRAAGPEGGREKPPPNRLLQRSMPILSLLAENRPCSRDRQRERDPRCPSATLAFLCPHLLPPGFCRWPPCAGAYPAGLAGRRAATLRCQVEVRGCSAVPYPRSRCPGCENTAPTAAVRL